MCVHDCVFSLYMLVLLSVVTVHTRVAIPTTHQQHTTTHHHTTKTQDMMQVWINCNIYNKKGDYVQKLGARCEALFSQEWARSGLSGGVPRARRTNAGVAAEKYEPPAAPEKKRTLSSGPKTTSKVAPSRSRQGKVWVWVWVLHVCVCDSVFGIVVHGHPCTWSTMQTTSIPSPQHIHPFTPPKTTPHPTGW